MNETTGNGPQNFRVEKASVTRADVKDVHVERMSVGNNAAASAESDLLREVKDALTAQTSTISTSLDNIRKQLVSSIPNPSSPAAQFDQQSRADAARVSTETANAASDTRDLKGAIDELKNAIVSQVAAEAAIEASIAAGGDDDGGGRGGGSSGGQSVGEAVLAGELLGEARSLVNRLVGRGQGFSVAFDAADKLVYRQKDAEGSLADLQDRMKRLSESGDLVIASFGQIGTGAIRQLESNLINAVDQLQEFGANLTNTRKITQFASERFSDSLDMATTGAINFTDAFFDFFPALIRGGDNLQDTFRLVRSSVDSDLLSPIGTFGTDIEGVSEGLRAYRNRLGEDSQAIQILGFRDASEALVTLLSLEKRRDVMANINSTITDRNISNQLDFAQMIAQNTGRTALEVVKLNEQHAKSLRNLEAGGVLNGTARQNFETAISVFAGTPGMAPFAELLSGVARAGGSVDLFLGNNSDLATDLSLTGQIPLLRSLVDQVKSGGAGTSVAQNANILMALARQFGINPDTGVAGASVISETGLGLFGAAGFSRDFTDRKQDDSVTPLIRDAEDALANSIPNLGIVVALGANTLALGANTLALWRARAPGGFIGGGPNKGKQGKIGQFMGKAGAGIGAGIGTAKAGTGSAMKAAGRAGMTGLRALGSLAKKIPGIGIGAGIVLGAGRALGGDFTGAGLEVASGLAGTVPGLGTAASLGIDGALLARDTGMLDGTSASKPQTVVPTKGPSTLTTNSGLRNPTERLLLQQNKMLKSILNELEDQTKLSDDIKTNTGRPPPPPERSFLGGLFGSDAGDVVAHG